MNDDFWNCISTWVSTAPSQPETIEHDVMMIDMCIAVFCNRCQEKCLDRIFKTRGVVTCSKQPSWPNYGLYTPAPIDFTYETSQLHTWTSSETWQYDIKLAEDFGL